MVVVSAPTANNICESFTHNPLTWDQVKPTLLYFMGFHKEFIANTSKFKSDFGGGKHVCTYVAMGDHQYILHYNIAFLHPKNETHSSVTAQPHTWGHRCRIPSVPKQCLRLSPSKKNEQFPQENLCCSYR